jgi:hypothetical protein
METKTSRFFRKTAEDIHQEVLYKKFDNSKENEAVQKKSSRNICHSSNGDITKRRHLSVLDGNKAASRSNSIAEAVELQDSYENCSNSSSNPVFSEESSLPKSSLDTPEKTTSTRAPPASAIQTSGPPDIATSTPPFPQSGVKPANVSSLPTPKFSPDTLCRLPYGVINIELDDGLYEYSAEVIVYLKRLEQDYVLTEDFLENNSVDGNMRGVLVDWLVQVQHYLKLSQETLHIAVHLLDTVLDRREVMPTELQLVGVTSLLVASKMEEYYPADIKKLVNLTDNSYSSKEILHMEKIILDVVSFKVYFPTSEDFLSRFTRAALRSEDLVFLKTCQLLTDCNLPHPSHSCLAPSLLAAAAVYVTSLLFNISANCESHQACSLWTTTLRHYTRYKQDEVVPAGLAMLQMFLSEKYSGVRTKYKSNSQHDKLVLKTHLQEDVVKRALTFLSKDHESS